jgi:hypothetical protein
LLLDSYTCCFGVFREGDRLFDLMGLATLTAKICDSLTHAAYTSLR